MFLVKSWIYIRLIGQYIRMILESIFGSVLVVEPICKIETSAIFVYRAAALAKKTAEI